MLELKTAGESHGRGLMAVLEGLPAGIEIDIDLINGKLARRQGGYGRGGRMKIEKDRVEFFSGIRSGRTIGSPIGLLIYNRDWENWQKIMEPLPEKMGKDGEERLRPEELEIVKDGRIKRVKSRLTRPRPGHADLAGSLKYQTGDIRDILERASARETAVRTAAGGVTDCFLRNFNIEIISHVIQLGSIKAPVPEVGFAELKERVCQSPVSCYDRRQEEEMLNHIDQAKSEGDSLGGVIEVRTTPLPVGLGSHVHWDRRLDGRLAGALLSIPAVKGLEIGPAFSNSVKRGSEVHDEIYYSRERGFYRESNRAGGLEGGITNGEPLLIRLAMKPIPTLYKPLNSVDITTGEAFTAGVERSDVTAVPAAGVVGEAVVSFVLAGALLEKFGGDHLTETLDNYRRFQARCRI